ncbi:MAG TPA: ribonuclease III [Bacteroidales bacterium]|nr:ribonuclease III [Bacteroidales bacterium]HRZ76969.1 ribonuclease III [Bacteroidales bacterium]
MLVPSLNAVRAVISPDRELRRAIRNIFGFWPGNIYPYKLAFRHKSASREFIHGTKVSNERLEYLGDAVLSAVVADFLFKKYPSREEGFLTDMRAKLVSRAQLNKLSVKMGVEQLILASPDINNQARSMSGDAFEAFIGALYLDRGYHYARKVIIHRIINTHFDLEALENTEVNFKSRLIEWSQREKKAVAFKVVEEVGNGHGKQYVVEVRVDNEPVCSARDYSIKGAEKIAAEKVCSKLEIEKQHPAPVAIPVG